MRLATGCLAAILLILPGIAVAQGDVAQGGETQEGQFYFVARTAPESSLTRPASAEKVVFLRWDVLEGDLPTDVARLRLLRQAEGDEAEVIFEADATAVMPAAAIAGLYRGTANERRLLETVTRLKEYAVSQGDNFSTSQFAVALRERLVNDALWSFLASRSDFNIARARYRAYLDRPDPGVYTYELLAVNAAGETARLGMTRIDTRGVQQLLPVQRFRQVYQATCDSPEYAKDHYTVSLNWDAPGSDPAGNGNLTDQIASQVFISGYDLYRTRENLDPSVTTVPARDLAAEAAQASYDNQGTLQLADLEKVNDVLLTIAPDNALTPEWMETYNELASAGLEPGDKRAYYLVPRDFTGNYGPTHGAIIVVPNLVRPATPWDVRLFADNASSADNQPRMVISFDQVNLDNYVAAYGESRNICNADEAADSGILEFVAPGQSCETDARRQVNLNVIDYQVYRFANFETASEFSDSDGDGFGNAEERDRGYHCNPALPTGETPQYRVDPNTLSSQTVALADTGRTRIQLEDSGPANAKGVVFWYRIAARTADGRVSLLTPPVRALFPDRELPSQPSVTAKRPGEVTQCEVQVRDADRWTYTNNVGGGSVAVHCGEETFDFNDKVFTSGDFCAKAFNDSCGGSGRSLTLNAGADVSCTVDLPDSFSFCGNNELVLDPVQAEGEVPLGQGKVIAGPVTYTAAAPEPDTCVSIYQTIDGQASQVATSCGTASPGSVEYEAESGFFCGYAVTHDQNNNTSVPEPLPCAQISPANPKSPSTPQPVSFSVVGTEAQFSWRLPMEPVAAVLARLQPTGADGDQGTQIVSIPTAGRGAGDVQDYRVDVPALVDEQDQWCLSLKAVAPNAIGRDSATSAWSSPRCATRSRAALAPPEYLPWPSLPPAPQGEPLAVHLGAELIDPTRLNTADMMHLYFDLADVTGLADYCGYEGLEPDETSAWDIFVQLTCRLPGMVKSQAAVMPQLNMLVYRQRRNLAGELQDWIQVSPLIEYAHWDHTVLRLAQLDNPIRVAVLNDPYIKAYKLGTTGDSVRFVFTDRYPYIGGQDYRYQVVYFTGDHRIAHWRQSDWITADVGEIIRGIGNASGVISEEVSNEGVSNEEVGNE